MGRATTSAGTIRPATEIFYLLIPLGLAFLAVAVAAFVRAVRPGRLDDP
ncbi:MAG: cbb3-type cytochrome oxidase assembly protein CcoS, partial [Gammaproteobacteria bacterium]|nr:cbb3-type cytochrome oxidase assembly protein CcoS [Gammaproteobacteria bacterium]